MKKRLHALFSGNVQGVGFRFTAERMARRYSVAGYVRNLSNGKVELVAEGEKKSVQEFFGAIREAFQSYVDGVETRWARATGEFKDFGIRF